MEKMVVKQGKIKEIDLVNKYASPAVKESYIKNGKLLTKNKRTLLEKMSRYCKIVDLGKREYEITEVYPYILPANFKKMNTSLYQYIVPLLLENGRRHSGGSIYHSGTGACRYLDARAFPQAGGGRPCAA